MVSQWYGEGGRELDILTGTAVWDHPGRRVPVRWAVEVTFEELGAEGRQARRHLGVETQRQWPDKAIARTTPALLALFSLVALWANDLVAQGRLDSRCAAWYSKRHMTFSDALGAVRRKLWEDGLFRTSGQYRDVVKIPVPLAQRLLDAACFPA